MENFKKYIVLWLSQSISQLGSSMTAFSFILWIYEQTHSALSISIISFCNYVPYILTSIFVGTFVDNHRKKLVMLCLLYTSVERMKNDNPELITDMKRTFSYL